MFDRVSESEKLVMEVLWQESPLSSSDVVEKLSDSGWNQKTVKTFLNRLVKKGVLSYKTEGRKYLYYPAIERHVFLAEESDGFINKIFSGDIKELLTTFVQNKNLSRQELDYLKKLLEAEDHKK